MKKVTIIVPDGVDVKLVRAETPTEGASDLCSCGHRQSSHVDVVTRKRCTVCSCERFTLDKIHTQLEPSADERLFTGPVDTVKFVRASDLFKGLGDLRDEFGTNSPASWGSNAFTLVERGAIMPHVGFREGLEHEQMVLQERVDALPSDVEYVDLEH